MIADVHQLQRAFDEAELRVGTAALDALLAEDFRSIGERGYVLDKAQWVGKFAGGTEVVGRWKLGGGRWPERLACRM